jgi:hypothetical protein
MERLRARAEEARAKALRDAATDAEAATRLLADALLADPLSRLGRLASDDAPEGVQAREQLLALIKEIYRLDDTDEDEESGR